MTFSKTSFFGICVLYLKISEVYNSLKLTVFRPLKIDGWMKIGCNLDNLSGYLANLPYPHEFRMEPEVTKSHGVQEMNQTWVAIS